MKAVKGKLIKKLKTIKTIGYLKTESILQVSAFEGYLSKSTDRAPFQEIHQQPNRPNGEENIGFLAQEPEIIDVSELMKDLEDQEMESDGDINDKENVRPNGESKSKSKSEKLSEISEGFSEEKVQSLSEISISGFKPPDLDSNTLFDPNLLAAFEQAVMEVKAREAKFWEEELELEPLPELEKVDPLLEFQQNCPPNGSDSVVLYVTGLRGIRKTFEDCHKVRSLLENLRILFFERDMSMHSGYKDELFEMLGGKVAPPRLFVKGRYIGGAEEVLTLHEQGKLKPLLEGLPVDPGDGPCDGCGGIRFVVCFNCDGSRRIVVEGSGGCEAVERKEGNENGVVICPFCC